MTDERTPGNTWKALFLVISGLLSGLLGVMGYLILDNQVRHSAQLAGLVTQVAVMAAHSDEQDIAIIRNSIRSAERHAEQAREIDRTRTRIAALEKSQLRR